VLIAYHFILSICRRCDCSPERLQEEDLTPPDYRGGLDRYGRPLRTKEEAALWKATNKNKQLGM
jgi:hypothetical protein